MKTAVRAFVLILTLTGSAAYAKLATTATAKTTSDKLNAPLSIGGPVPCCEPDDPDACGLGKKR